MCNAYSKHQHSLKILLHESNYYVSLISLCILFVTQLVLVIIHKRHLVADIDRLFTFHLITSGIIHCFGTLYTHVVSKIDWTLAVGMRTIGTWGCLLSSALLSYNLQIVSNRNLFEKRNQQRYVYFACVWLVSIVAACIETGLYIMDAKPECFVSLFDFIVCIMAITFCLISMYYWYKEYQCKIYVILWSMLKYLSIIILSFFPSFLTKLYYYSYYIHNNFSSDNFEPYFSADLISLLCRSFYDASIGLLVLYTQYPKLKVGSYRKTCIFCIAIYVWLIDSYNHFKTICINWLIDHDEVNSVQECADLGNGNDSEMDGLIVDKSDHITPCHCGMDGSTSVIYNDDVCCKQSTSQEKCLQLSLMVNVEVTTKSESGYERDDNTRAQTVSTIVTRQHKQLQLPSVHTSQIKTMDAELLDL